MSHMYRDVMPKRMCAVRPGPLLASHNLDLEARYWLCILTGCLEVRADHSIPDDPPKACISARVLQISPRREWRKTVPVWTKSSQQ